MLRDPSAYIHGYEQLAGLRVGFYPIHPDKSPAVQGKLNRVATIDPVMINYWAEYRHHRSFAARFLRGCRLLVIDTENPFKRPDEPGPDGELFLGSILEDSDIILPSCPMVQTGSEGFHRYVRVPKGFRIRPQVAIWPGIDLLAAGSSAILPGSRTDAGEYRTVRSFEDCPIPEAPRAFVKLIRRIQGTTPSRTALAPTRGFSADLDTTVVSRRQWFLLFRNCVFRSFWNRQGKAGDATDSAYEYHLAKACFCCGLNGSQAESVVLNWRLKHRLQRDLRKLRYGIILRAWAEVAPWVEGWHAKHEAAEESKVASKTANRVLTFMAKTVKPQSPAAVAAELGLSRECAKKVLRRLEIEGKLERSILGYRIVTNGDILMYHYSL